MKTMMTRAGSLLLFLMGCLLMVSCGSDSDSDAPRGSDPISGSWKIISATEKGAPVGAVCTFSGTSSIKMTMDGTESSGMYSYNASTGAFSLSVDGKSISGTIVFDGDNATLTYDSGNGVETVMLQKESGSGGEGGDASSLMMGSWVIKSTTVPGGSANETVIFGDENLYKVSGLYLSCYSFSGSEAANIFAIYDLFGYDELQGEIVFSKNGKGAQQAEISCYNPDGDPNVKWIIRMTKFSDYNLPSESPTASKPYLGDWMLESSTFSGMPADLVGRIFRFTSDNQLFVNGDEKPLSLSYSETSAGKRMTITTPDGTIAGNVTFSDSYMTYVLDGGMGTMEFANFWK